MDRGEKQPHGAPGKGRAWTPASGPFPKNEPVELAIMPSARKQFPDKTARVERSYRKIMLWG
jgi:hypothetical protein